MPITLKSEFIGTILMYKKIFCTYEGFNHSILKEHK